MGVNALWHACKRQNQEMLEFLLNFRLKGKEKVAKCYFDPTY